jgi:small subunit ribosomal protein S9
MSDTQEIWATGRRKTAVARVKLLPGSGKVHCNGRELDEYFPRRSWRLAVRRPLETVEAEDRFDIHANLTGGGLTGQADALMLGIARALEKHDPELRQVLKDHGLLRRDARAKERKKYGRRGARASFQFSKR